jgi:hypothetical protein
MEKEKNTTEKIAALKQLKDIMKKCKDKKCFAVVTHVSKSGMSRNVHFMAFTKGGGVYNLDGFIHKIIGYSFSNNSVGLRVGGCGMDMIFKTLYDLNNYALAYNVIKTSKKKDRHSLQYNGIINTYYNYFQ